MGDSLAKVPDSLDQTIGLAGKTPTLVIGTSLKGSQTCLINNEGTVCRNLNMHIYSGPACLIQLSHQIPGIDPFWMWVLCRLVYYTPGSLKQESLGKVQLRYVQRVPATPCSH